MRKKILIGSMLILTLLLLMPSIPAIQQKTIEDGVRQDLQEKLESINFEELKDLNLPVKFRFRPILQIIFLIIWLRGGRGLMLSFFASHWDRNFFVIDFPIIYLRGEWLFYTSMYILDYFHILYQIIGYPIFFLIMEIIDNLLS